MVDTPEIRHSMSSLKRISSSGKSRGEGGYEAHVLRQWHSGGIGFVQSVRDVNVTPM